MSFEDFNFHHDVLEGLRAMGFEKPTPIQEQSIPVIMQNKDLIACAQTGTGKTAAYLLPILNKLSVEGNNHSTDTVIVVPTRELALQIDQQIEGFAYFLSVTSIAIYGGNDGKTWDQQKAALVRGADIIIATPGRLLQHANMGYVKLDKVKHLILDEADRMLDMGFYDDITKIVEMLPAQRQNLMFSATMPGKIRELAKKTLNEPEQINIALSKPAEGVLQAAYMLYEEQKIPVIRDLLTGKDYIKSIIIFTSTKIAVRKIETDLCKAGFTAKGIQSDLEQSERESVLREFRNRNFQILVATDIMARGIDIDEIGLVINFDVPKDAEDYIHRIGRTARAESTGVGITFITEKDQNDFKDIEDLIGSEIYKIKLSPALGAQPVYNPGVKKKNFKNFKEKIKGKHIFSRKKPDEKPKP